MALGTLSLSTTQGVQGRRFAAKINGLTTGKVEVLGHAGSPGFSTVNGMLYSNGLPYPVSTVVLREYQPGVGAGYLDTRIDITATTPYALQQQANAAIGGGRTMKGYRVAGTVQGDGSIVYSLYVTDDLGATSVQAAGNTSVPLTAPTGFGYTPTFTISQAANGAVTHNYDPTTRYAPSFVSTYYVGPGGSDANDGLTWATRFASLAQGITAINAISNGQAKYFRLRAQAGEYANALGFNGKSCTRQITVEPCDASGNVLPIADGRFSLANQIISSAYQPMPVYVATADPNIYVSTYTTEAITGGMWDKAFTNRFGRPLGLRNVSTDSVASIANPIPEINAMHTKFGKGAFCIDATNKKLWVRTKDGRAPDANVFVAKNTGASHLYFSAGFGLATQSYGRNIDLWGGPFSTFADATASSGATQNVTLHDSYVGYSSKGNSISAIHGGTMHNYRNVVSDSNIDAFAYMVADTDATNPTHTFYEIDCIAEYVGSNEINDSSTNCTTSHRNCIGTRVNNFYAWGSNRQLHDIMTSKSWNVGISFGPSTRSSAAAGGLLVSPTADAIRAAAGAAAGYLNPITILGQPVQETAQAWLDTCTFVAPFSFALAAYSNSNGGPGGKVHYRNCVLAGLSSDISGGAVDTY